VSAKGQGHRQEQSIQITAYQGGGAQPNASTGNPGTGNTRSSDDDVVDAEFQEVA
jgi:hypothetical protein